MRKHVNILVVLTSFLVSQSFNVPVYFQTGFSLGYDSNFLKLSDSDENNAMYSPEILGDSESFDSGILKPSLKIEYSPVLIKDIETRFKFSASTSFYSSSKDKLYSKYFGEFGVKFKPYQWLKVGSNVVPKYYIRPFKDVDLNNGLYYPASFSNNAWFFSYSNPITKKSWMKFSLNFSEQYFLPSQSHFTEYDTQVSSVSLIYNLKLHYGKVSILGMTGKGDNISFNDELTPISTSVDRSYKFDKLKISWTRSNMSNSIYSKWGSSIQLNQRLYELNSIESDQHDWKYYLESQFQIWTKLSFINDVELKVEYKYKQRHPKAADGGEFEWVEDTKQYQKHELWLRFTFDSVLDLAY